MNDGDDGARFVDINESIDRFIRRDASTRRRVDASAKRNVNTARKRYITRHRCRSRRRARARARTGRVKRALDDGHRAKLMGIHASPSNIDRRLEKFKKNSTMMTTDD